MSQDLFPSSMCETDIPRGVKWLYGAWWVPIFCASCGADGGLVPEAHVTFAFYLCNGCSKKYGRLTCTMVEPDAAFWERVAQEQLDKYGRYLTTAELQDVAVGSSSLSTLLKEGK